MALTCWSMALTCWSMALTCWNVASTCWIVETSGAVLLYLGDISQIRDFRVSIRSKFYCSNDVIVGHISLPHHRVISLESFESICVVNSETGFIQRYRGIFFILKFLNSVLIQVNYRPHSSSFRFKQCIHVQYSNALQFLNIT